ncbi:hypothetical protein [Amphritea pacifica]|uniref:Regulatory signaling modulator protein AmpE n=1 Tax=Amphritea pacifica TaxID=2811233 RepID=A0ABS2W7L1_9GAMM|nr:hypothetical protein [Amphritea pacifica]MBN0987693.1 hypothetical protein [Amphritea pacifica]MBN1007722.1 hypothetical protein [Amphritea pacifica]
MKFLAVMLVMVLGRYTRRSPKVIRLARAATPQSTLHWVMLTLYMVALEALLLQFFRWEFGIFVLAIELAALYLYLENWSPSDITGKYYRDWCKGNFQASWLQLAELLGLNRTDDVTDCQSAHYAICQQYLYLSLVGFFALLFWFILLGIPGLFLALWAGWLIQHKHTKRQPGIAELVIRIPARLLGFTFFIVGNGLSAYTQLKNPEAKDHNVSDWLFRIALAAVGEESYQQYRSASDCGDEEFRHHAAEEIISLNRLIRRSAILWLMVFGVLTMLGVETPLY